MRTASEERWDTGSVRWGDFRQQYAEEPESELTKQFLPWAGCKWPRWPPADICHPVLPRPGVER